MKGIDETTTSESREERVEFGVQFIFPRLHNSPGGPLFSFYRVLLRLGSRGYLFYHQPSLSPQLSGLRSTHWSSVLVLSRKPTVDVAERFVYPFDSSFPCLFLLRSYLQSRLLVTHSRRRSIIEHCCKQLQEDITCLVVVVAALLKTR